MQQSLSFPEKREEIIKKYKKDIPTPGVNPSGSIVKDPRRILDKKDKEIVFDNAPVAVGFDQKIFKKDVLGALVMKGLVIQDKQRKKLAFEYEHVTSHTHGGFNCYLNY